MSIDPDDTLRWAVVAALDRASRDLGPQLAPLQISDDQKRSLIAQNVLRMCMEVICDKMLPFGPEFLTDLGTRLAAYAVTAGPPRETHHMIEQIQRLLPAMVENKQKSGAGIRAEWREPKP